MIRYFLAPRALVHGCITAAALLFATACDSKTDDSDAGSPDAEDATGGGQDSKSDTGDTDPSGSGETTGSSDTNPGTDSGGDEFEYNACARENQVGQVRIELTDTFTGISGKILNAMIGDRFPEVVAEANGCKLYRYIPLTCDPKCQPGTETCTKAGNCIEYPVGQDLGTITIEGMKDEVAMTPRPPGNNYGNTGSLTHPGFDPGDVLTLNAEGNTFSGFELRGRGIAPVSLTTEEFLVQRESAIDVEWQARARRAEPTMMQIELNIDHHGSSAAWIECLVGDTGSHQIDASLVTQLIEIGATGFPTISLSRRTVDSVDIEPGCVQFMVESTRIVPVIVEGVESCTEDAECNGICLQLKCACTEDADCNPGSTCLETGVCG